MPVEHFKSREAYRKNLAYRHMHGIPMTATSVVVGGKEHTVKHSRDPKRMKIDAKQRAKVSGRRLGSRHRKSHARRRAGRKKGVQ